MLGLGQAGPTGEVRLHRLDRVSVLMGPLPVGPDVWYLVWPAEHGVPMQSSLSWQEAFDDGGTKPGWVIATKAGEPWLSLERRPSPDEVLPWGPTLVAAGDGGYVSPPQPRHDLFSMNWAAAGTGSDCEFNVRLVPSEGGPVEVVAVIASTGGADVVQGPLSGPGSQVHTLWPMDGETWDAYTVEVRSGCPWTVALTPVGHD
ncbi:MAG TPA: hypothetical protein VFO05_13055 [Candidatus Limnocylindrales bacterium]|nr:hypothetical protein [Candidatus Limnocylindrales bacterium]